MFFPANRDSALLSDREKSEEDVLSCWKVCTHFHINLTHHCDNSFLPKFTRTKDVHGTISTIISFTDHPDIGHPRA